MQSEIRDRYISFENIDCYENAINVLKMMDELFEVKPKSKNAFWERFFENIPQNYEEEFALENNKDILYHVCSNVFYISDLFEAYDYEKGIEYLDQCELECC